MAEIRIEPKRRSLTWLWVIIALAVIAAIVWYMYSRGAISPQADTSTTGALPLPVAALVAYG